MKGCLRITITALYQMQRTASLADELSLRRGKTSVVTLLWLLYFTYGIR